MTLTALIILVSVAIQAAEISPVLKGDIVIEPKNGALHAALQKQLEQYRDSLRSINLSPSLKRLAGGERERMRQVLEAHGYYDADIIYRITPASEVDYTIWERIKWFFIGSREVTEHIQYRIDTDEQYTILSIDIDGVEIEPPEDWPEFDIGSPLVAEDILSDQSRLRAIVDEQGCYYTLEVTHQVHLKEKEQGGHLVYRVLANKPSKIGDVSFEGVEGVNERFLRRQTGLEDGACFSRASIDQAVLNLYQTKLFATVRRSLNRQENGRVDAHFEVIQRPPRTLRAGVGWDTDQGFGLSLGWEHRNLLGRAQWLELGTELQRDRQVGNVKLTIPGFLEARNTLTWNNSLSHETPEDDEYYIAESRATIDRQASRRDTYRYGIAYQRSDERENKGKWNAFSLLRFPLAYEFDENPNSLNPRSGYRYNVGLEPVVSLNESSDPFYVGSLGWASFRPFGDNIVLANRLDWTSIWPLTSDADLDNIPKADRLLAGGSGSVRGYPYRSIGVEGSNSGGTQEWAGSLELRTQWGGNWGTVLFTDVASVSEEWNPFGSQEWFAGGGVGVRYYTSLAPIRFDVAFPLTQREGDPRYQIYLSLGQAF